MSGTAKADSFSRLGLACLHTVPFQLVGPFDMRRRRVRIARAALTRRRHWDVARKQPGQS